MSCYALAFVELSISFWHALQGPFHDPWSVIDSLKHSPVAGVDPKSIVCEYFRAGQCQKGFKCKFSHDLAVERKGGKIDLFTDT